MGENDGKTADDFLFFAESCGMIFCMCKLYVQNRRGPEKGAMTMELFREHYDGETLRAVPVLTLAHVGDGVYELLARTEVLSREILRVEDAHRRTVELVTAPAQARAARAILPLLTAEESAVFRRGRNAHPHSTPKHCTLGEYALATGLEALFGWLYLSGQGARIAELWLQVLENARPREARL